MYVLHVMLTLLLQKSSKSSKSKDRVAALKRRLKKWKNGDFLHLLREANRPSKSITKDWNDGKHQRGIKKVP